MKKAYYAYEVFPWIEIDRSYTIEGLFCHRETFQRRAWGQVLSGTNEQIIEAAVKMDRLFGLSKDITADDIRLFYLNCIEYGYTEQLLLHGYLPKNELVRFYFSGLRAGRDAGKEPTE